MNGKTVLLRQSKLCSDSQMARNAQLTTSLCFALHHIAHFCFSESVCCSEYTFYIYCTYIIHFTVYDIHISTLAIVNGDHTLYILQCIIYSIHISTHCEWTSYIVQLYNCRFHTFTILWEEVSTTVRKNWMPWQDLPGQLCPKNVTILILKLGYQVLRLCCPPPNFGP